MDDGKIRDGEAAKAENGDSAGPGGLMPVFPMLEPGEFALLSKRNFELMSRATRAYFDSASEFNKHFAEFLNQRVRKDFEIARALMKAKNSDDAFVCQSEFLEEAIRDYGDESARFFSIAAKKAHEILASSEERAP